MDIEHYIEETNRAETAEEVFRLFQTHVAALGFDKSIFGGATNDELFKDRFEISLPAPILVNNYPEDWTKHYLQNDYARFDPVIAMMPRQWGPLVWRDIAKKDHITRKQKRLLRESEDAGLRNGVSLPMRGPDGETFVISLASEHAGDLDLAQNLPQLRVIAAQFFFSFMDLWAARRPEPQSVSLTRREQECLQWSARGKSAWDISVILNISEATVRFHLSNAFSKLGAGNRVSAIVRALRWGLIQL
ncbi:LuxR family transcriptional regulator [Telmatospirillum sp. J64-1]|uniref:LuxR family transcriptional regulator n=1 Tax=Telmatospirillum sp. J64-1 TaxID=2502183 RepID=UPI00115D8F7B|nr:LuxR family transcriptional regulator [Telmatospirillum sp. J64-1]